MTFKEDAEKDDKCHKCGNTVIYLCGGGWDNDRAYCSDFIGCDYEKEYETSTDISNI